MSEHDLLTTEEVASELRISDEAARKLMTSGKLAFVQVTAGERRMTRRVRRDTLEAFKRNEQRATFRDELRGVRETVSAMASVEQRW